MILTSNDLMPLKCRFFGKRMRDISDEWYRHYYHHNYEKYIDQKLNKEEFAVMKYIDKLEL